MIWCNGKNYGRIQLIFFLYKYQPQSHLRLGFLFFENQHLKTYFLAKAFSISIFPISIGYLLFTTSI
jgi:hypothetical protein